MDDNERDGGELGDSLRPQHEKANSHATGV